MGDPRYPAGIHSQREEKNTYQRLGLTSNTHIEGAVYGVLSKKSILLITKIKSDILEGDRLPGCERVWIHFTSYRFPRRLDESGNRILNTTGPG